uniref:C-type lectin domain-containing protein n=1 Tax=Astyanax mexicanus TaxID=7994 RepID=A0A8B9K570_ASTMX
LVSCGMYACGMSVYTECDILFYVLINFNYFDYSFLACPKKWEYHGGKCYFFSENRLNWTRSRDHCISIGGHLAIKSIEEQVYIQLVQSKMMTDNDRFWIGLTDEQVETQWLHWLEKEPDNWTVILINPTGEDYSDNWHDENCATLHKSVCESISPNNG